MPSSRSPLVLLFALLTLLVSSVDVGAQRFTTTLPWIDGDTIIVSQSTNALGATLAIETLSTILPLTTGGTLRPTTTALVPTTTALVPTTTALVPTTTTPLVPTTTTTPVRVTADPTTTARRPTTSLAIVATPTPLPSGEIRTVPAGTIMDYSEYQQSINQAAQTGGTNPAMDGTAGNGAIGGKVGGAWVGGVVGVVVVGLVGVGL